MLGDLIANVLPGMKRDDIVALLGDPSEGNMRHADLVWCLGLERGLFGIDSEWLLVWFDDGGVVSRSELGHD